MTIGILGGGQLSRMLILAGTALGVDFCVFDPHEASATAFAQHRIIADYNDTDALQTFAKSVDVVTYENENIPDETLTFLSKTLTIHPNPNGLQKIQDRLFEKQYLNNLDIETAQFHAVNSIGDLAQLKSTLAFPCILKKRRFGYDGKGQVVLHTADDINTLSADILSDSIIESFVPFDREISIIGARNAGGETCFYDICENTHKNGVLYKTENKVNDPIQRLAESQLFKVLNDLNYVGVCALECFQVGNTLIANELAPRVHNSGHWTIEGAITSQFENHIRALLNWPLGNTLSQEPVTMFNLLSHIPEKTLLLEHPGLHLHDYHKPSISGRKVGHITLCADAHIHAKQIEATLQA